MENSTNNSGITTKFGAITIDSVGEDQFKKDFYSVQLRQELTTTYPVAGGGSDKSDTIASMLGGVVAGGKEYNKTRIVWDLFPKEIADANGVVTAFTPEQAKAKYAEILAANPNARITQELANDVTLVLNDKQLNALSNPEIDYSLEDAQVSHVIKDKEGVIVQPVQYSSKQLSFSGGEDVDMRTNVSVEEVAATTVEEALTA